MNTPVTFWVILCVFSYACCQLLSPRKEHEVSSREKRSIITSLNNKKSYLKDNSIHELVTQLLEVENEIKKKIYEKLEERLQAGVAEGQISILNYAANNNKKIKDDLLKRVNELENTYEELRKEVDSGYWKVLQSAMLEHARRRQRIGMNHRSRRARRDISTEWSGPLITHIDDPTYVLKRKLP